MTTSRVLRQGTRRNAALRATRLSAAELPNSFDMKPRNRGGPPDPKRRERIARAAVEVVAAHGVDGLTHRRVAKAAGIPLGSTTYHFKTLDEVLTAGLEYAVAEAAEDLRQWAAELTPETDLVEATTELVMRRIGDERARTIVNFELYVAALRRPYLRPLCTTWVKAVTGAFRPQLNEAAARFLTMTLDGLMLEALVSGRRPSRSDTKALIRRALSCSDS